MWNCRVSSGGRVSEYGAYATVFDNIVAFVVGYERSARTYVDLIEENRTLFLDASDDDDDAPYTVVEPRELLFLMNHVDTTDRLYWAPRPYRRSGDITKEYLFACPENDTLSCLFCGFKGRSPLETKYAPVEGGITRSSLFEDTVLNRRNDVHDDNSSISSSGSNNNTAAATTTTPEISPFEQFREAIVTEASDVFRSGRMRSEENFGGINEFDDSDSDGDDESRNGSGPTPNDDNDDRNRRTPSGYHFANCPLIWLEKNCAWRTKYSSYQIHEPSKFGDALELLSRRSLSMCTEMEWNEFVKLTSNTTAMGACEDTLVRCFRKIVEMKLDGLDRYHGDSREFRRLPLYTVYYETLEATTTERGRRRRRRRRRQQFCRPLACVLPHSSLYGSAYRIDKRRTALNEPYVLPPDSVFNALRAERLVNRVNEERVKADYDEKNEARNYLSSVLSSSSSSSSAAAPQQLPPKGRVVYTIEMETAWRAFVLHGFCVQHKSDDAVAAEENVYEAVAFGNFVGSRFGGYVIRHKTFVPTVDVICVYCGYGFDSRLCPPELVDRLYDREEKTALAEYLLSRSSTMISNETTSSSSSSSWWKRANGPNRHLALSTSEIFSPSKNWSTGPRDENNERLAVWLSTSLNLSHSLRCVFRTKKRNWKLETCPVCLTENTAGSPKLTCGHTLCDTCLNDVRLTACPLCKRGTRKHRITVHPRKQN